jgi:hypothetical protein
VGSPIQPIRPCALSSIESSSFEGESRLKDSTLHIVGDLDASKDLLGQVELRRIAGHGGSVCKNC